MLAPGWCTHPQHLTCTETDDEEESEEEQKPVFTRPGQPKAKAASDVSPAPRLLPAHILLISVLRRFHWHRKAMKKQGQKKNLRKRKRKYRRSRYTGRLLYRSKSSSCGLSALLLRRMFSYPFSPASLFRYAPSTPKPTSYGSQTSSRNRPRSRSRITSRRGATEAKRRRGRD